MQPDPARQETLDLERYVPALLSLLSNKLSAAASRECRGAFGLGATDWRVMAEVAVSPRSSAARLCLRTGLDKAAVSRSFAVLAGRGLVRLETRGRDREATLSTRGEHLHPHLLALAIEREQRLLAGLSDHETGTLRGLLQRLVANLPAIDAPHADTQPRTRNASCDAPDLRGSASLPID